jgi:hypothetical protein
MSDVGGGMLDVGWWIGLNLFFLLLPLSKNNNRLFACRTISIWGKYGSTLWNYENKLH